MGLEFGPVGLKNKTWVGLGLDPTQPNPTRQILGWVRPTHTLKTASNCMNLFEIVRLLYKGFCKPTDSGTKMSLDINGRMGTSKRLQRSSGMLTLCIYDH